MPNSKGPQRGARGKLSNSPRDRGTSPPQRAVQEFEEGESVHLKLDPSVRDGRFHHRFNGHTGEVIGRQGAAYRVRISDRGKTKTVIAKPAHLRRQER